MRREPNFYDGGIYVGAGEVWRKTRDHLRFYGVAEPIRDLILAAIGGARARYYYARDDFDPLSDHFALGRLYGVRIAQDAMLRTAQNLRVADSVVRPLLYGLDDHADAISGTALAAFDRLSSGGRDG